MANLLDEINGPVNDEGQDVRVINRRIPAEVGFGSVIFQIALWITIPLLVVLYVLAFRNEIANPGAIIIWGCILGILPGVIFIFMKISARNYFLQLEQRIQAEASNIDNYIEQRVQILQNVVGLVERSVAVDTEVMTAVAALRSGGRINDENRGEINARVDTAFGRLFPQVEAYPELKSQNIIAEATQQNNYLQREITAARTVYNSRVTQWNTDIFSWPTKKIVASKQGYTTRIPFSTDNKTREMARSKFF